MATKNDITGDSLVSRTSEEYRSNYDLIFRKGKQNEQRTGLHDGKLDTRAETSNTGELPEPADYPHDRTNRDSEH